MGARNVLLVARYSRTKLEITTTFFILRSINVIRQRIIMNLY